MAITKQTVIDGLHITISSGAVIIAHVSQALQVLEDGEVISQIRIPPQPVQAAGPLSLAGVLSAVQSAALASNVDLTARVATLTADLATANATVATQTQTIAARDATIVNLNAQIAALPTAADLAAANATIAQQAARIKQLEEIITPHPSIPTKCVQQAIVESKLSDFWEKALGTVAPEDAKEWFNALGSSINFTEPWWANLVTAMTAMGAWKDDGAALIEMAKQIAGNSNAQEAQK